MLTGQVEYPLRRQGGLFFKRYEEFKIMTTLGPISMSDRMFSVIARWLIVVSKRVEHRVAVVGFLIVSLIK